MGIFSTAATATPRTSASDRAYGAALTVSDDQLLRGPYVRCRTVLLQGADMVTSLLLILTEMANQRRRLNHTHTAKGVIVAPQIARAHR